MDYTIMKKITTLSLITALSFSSFTYAGMMGEGEAPYCLSTFFLIEGGYSDNTIESYNLNIANVDTPFTPTESSSQIAGRVAVGVSNKIDEFGVTGEIGWGYFGDTTVTATSPFGNATLSNKYTIYGFDILAGVAWVPSNFTLFVKGGALIQTMSVTSTATFTGMAVANSLSIDHSKTEVMPEIKAGGLYSFADNWAISASVLYAVGSNTKTSGTIDLAGNMTNININARNPSIAAVFVGLQYSI